MGAAAIHRGAFSIFILLLIVQGQGSSRNDGEHSIHSGTHTNLTKPHTANDSDGNGNHSQGHHGNGTHDHHGMHVASWNFDYVREPFVTTIFLILTAICKLGFHHAGILPRIFPESCLLIVLGTIVGGILHACDLQMFSRQMSPKVFFLILLPPISKADKGAYANFTAALFFLILLPPIILESSYSLHDRVFGDNLGTILLYAVIGTILNCCLLGPTLYGLALCGAMGSISISLIQCFVFSSLIVAVDPVAVLAIFQEIGVNNVLYFLVFGESLLNDAVTVVLYNMMKTFNEMDKIPLTEIFLGIASFFTISLGGLAIGLIFGTLTSLLTKYTTKVRVVEPLAIFTLAYASYLTAELFHFSGIISTIGCGLVQAQYAFHNISHKSSTTVIYFSKMMSTTSDCIIFMFLGIALVKDDHVWHTGFILWTIFLCLFFRFVGVYTLTFLANRINRLRIIDYEEQFIMAYGGLRGAVAFSLVAMLNKDTLVHQPLFETATLAVIIFTVFVQGITIKPLVKLLRIRRSDNKVLSMCDEINNHVTDHVMAGIEEILGYHGHNSFREIMGNYDDKYLKHWLQRRPQTKDDCIMELYSQIALQEYYDSNIGSMEKERYSSQMQLYPWTRSRGSFRPRVSSEDSPFTGLPTVHPQLLDQALDSHIKRLSTPPSSPVPRSPRTPMSPESDIEAPLATPEPDIRRRHQRQSSFLDFMRPESVDDDVFVEEPTVEHLRKWLVKNPGKELYHQKHDRNLTRDNDLLHHLHEKQRRTARLRKSLSTYYTPTSSGFASPIYGSPGGSMENLPGPRHLSNLGVISESVSEEAGDGPHPTLAPPVERRVRARAPMARAFSADSRNSVPQAKKPAVYASRRDHGRARLPAKAATFDHGLHSDKQAERSPLLSGGDVDIPKDKADSSRPATEGAPGAASPPHPERRGRGLLSRQNKIRDRSPTSRPFGDENETEVTTDTVPATAAPPDIESVV